MEQLLLTAIGLPGSSIKSIAAATGIQANTLYKWKTTPNHLSPEKADRLLLYFIENEPERLRLSLSQGAIACENLALPVYFEKSVFRI